MGGNGDSDRLVLTCRCGFRMSVTRAQLGKKGRCKGCRQSIRVSEENTRPFAMPAGDQAGEPEKASAEAREEAPAEAAEEAPTEAAGEVPAEAREEAPAEAAEEAPAEAAGEVPAEAREEAPAEAAEEAPAEAEEEAPAEAEEVAPAEAAEVAPAEATEEVSAEFALALIREKKYEEAKAAIQTLLEEDDSDGDVWYGLAYCLWKLREFTEARHVAERAVLQGSEKAEVLLPRICKQLELAEQGEEGRPERDSGSGSGAGSLPGRGGDALEAVGGASDMESAPDGGTEAGTPAGDTALTGAATSDEAAVSKPEAGGLTTERASGRVEVPSRAEEAEVEEEEEVGQAEVEHSCLVGAELDPVTVKQAARGRGDRSFPVFLQSDDSGVALSVRELSKARLGAILGAQLPWLAMGPVIMLGQCFFAGLNVFLIFLCILSFNPVGAFLCFYNAGVLALNLLVSGVYYLLFVFRFAKLVIFFVTGTPCVYVPAGVSVQDGLVAQFRRGQPVQILRLNLTKTLLSKHTQQENVQGCGCIALPITMVMRAGLVAFDILLGMLTVQREDYVLFAFVDGDPVELVELPTGFFERMKARKERRSKGERTILYIDVPPERADEVQERLEQSLGAAVQVVDEGMAEKTFWV